jgi:hypothetical protein
MIHATRALVFLLNAFFYVVQTAAIAAGLQVWLGWDHVWTIAAALAVIWMIPVPLVAGISGIVGAHYGWQWSWLASITLFAGIELLVIAIQATLLGETRPGPGVPRHSGQPARTPRSLPVGTGNRCVHATRACNPARGTTADDTPHSSNAGGGNRRAIVRRCEGADLSLAESARAGLLRSDSYLGHAVSMTSHRAVNEAPGQPGLPVIPMPVRCFSPHIYPFSALDN